jgi:membrane-associated phospholipid phosphatase
MGKICVVVCFSFLCAIVFWRLRGWIPTAVHHSYKTYAIWVDSALFGVVPSLGIQRHLRFELLDTFFRWVWFSYFYVIIFGSAFILIIGGETKRHLLSLILTLAAGLLIHYLLPTQPSWMAVEDVIRIHGDHFTASDKNLTAAMPSIHQAVICLFGCALWKYGNWGKVVAISYNILMLMAVVYLGEHFVVDSIAGILVAVQSWFLSKRILVNLMNMGKNSTGTT